MIYSWLFFLSVLQFVDKNDNQLAIYNIYCMFMTNTMFNGEVVFESNCKLFIHSLMQTLLGILTIIWPPTLI